MKCIVVTPVGPGHEETVKQAQDSVERAMAHSKGPFTEIQHQILEDIDGMLGRSKARNLIVKNYDADWYFFLDADDLMSQGAFEAMYDYLDYAAVWGPIVEISNGQIAPRMGQVLSISSIEELKSHDPYATIQMGHFVRGDVAKATPFNEDMDCGEDFDYYLRVWDGHKCIKGSHILFINIRGNHSTGPRSATGKQWREAVEKLVGKHEIKFPSYIAESIDRRKSNIKTNLSRGLPKVYERPAHSKKVGIVAGGPSLKKEIGKIKSFQRSGGIIASVNGAYDYLKKHKILSDLHTISDPREHNKRFVENPDHGTAYFISADCHPSLFDNLDRQDVRVWVPYEYHDDIEYPTYVGGGSTVTLRTIALTHMLGFRKFEFFGFDGCVNGAHHAYLQPENDGESTREVTYNGKEFQMTNWQIQQAEDFEKLVPMLGDDVKIKIHSKGVMREIYERHKLYLRQGRQRRSCSA